MDLFFFLEFILNLLFGAYFTWFSIHCIRTERLKRIFTLFLILGITFFVASLFYFLWAFSYVPYSMVDFSLISAILLFFRVIILLLLVSSIFYNSNILWFLLFYLLSLASFLFTESMSIIIIIVSFMILFLLSLSFFSKAVFRTVGIFGLCYALLSFVLLGLLYLGFGGLSLILLFSNVFGFFFLFELAFVIRHNTKIILSSKPFRDNPSVVLDFFKYLVFIVVVVHFVFIGTVAIHELGHYGVARFFDCGYSRIIYESGLPHTEILCRTDSSVNVMATLSFGILVPLVLSLFFFFSGGQFIREIGFLIAGFNLVISYRDFLDLGFSDVFALFVTIIGFIVVIFAIAHLVSSRAEEAQFLAFTQAHKPFNSTGGMIVS